jgi:hypothetical protein
MLAIAKAMTALFALLEPKITSPNSDILFYFHSLVVSQVNIVGYNLLSLILAFSVVNC